MIEFDFEHTMSVRVINFCFGVCLDVTFGSNVN